MNKEQRALFNKLTPLQKGVALAKYGNPMITDYDAYVEAKGGSVTNANSAKAIVSRMLTDANLAAFMVSIQTPIDDKQIDSKVMSRQQMVEDLTLIANATLFDICDLIHADDEMMNVESGEMYTGMESFTVKRVSDIKDEHKKLIREIKQGKYGLEVKLIDPMQARKMLVEIQGMNAPIKTESTIKGELNVSDDELADKLKALGIGRNHNQLAGKSNGN